VIHTAQVAHNVSRSEEFGISIDRFRINMAAVRNRKRNMVQGLVDTHLALYKQSGAELVMASGRFVGPKMLEATLPDGTRRLLTGKNVVIGTGTHALIENIPGLASAQPLTHVEALELDIVPEHLIVLGSGYVGLEFAQAMRRFGSKVAVIDRNLRVIHHEDDDVTEDLQTLFQDEGIELVLGAKIKSVSGVSGQSARVTVEQNGQERPLDGTHLLVASGRVPNTKDIGLELTGVELTETGYIKVNERLETTAPGVWAVGEVAGSPHFTHISEDDFRVVRDNMLGGKRVTTGRQVPFCLFTDPEFARIGMSEKEAKQKGIAYRLFKVPMTHVLRARSLVETRGFLKCLVERDCDKILGFTAFGVGAGDYGVRADCNARRSTLHRTSRSRPHTSYDPRGTDCAIFVNSVLIRRSRSVSSVAPNLGRGTVIQIVGRDCEQRAVSVYQIHPARHRAGSNLALPNS
jgi:pyruvate/2-oxoglutarate dehydrogenase complex dihydrolipoamide dehydrogenase (E3) component